jgi:hypothetical protein
MQAAAEAAPLTNQAEGAQNRDDMRAGVGTDDPAVSSSYSAICHHIGPGIE